MPNQTARIHQFRSILDVIPRLTDTIGIVGSLLLLGARGSQAGSEELWLAAVMAVVVYYMTAEVTGLFRSWHGVAAEREVGCAGLTWVSHGSDLAGHRLFDGQARRRPRRTVARRAVALVSAGAGRDRRRANCLSHGVARRAKARLEYARLRDRRRQRTRLSIGPQYRKFAANGLEARRLFRRSPAGAASHDSRRRRHVHRQSRRFAAHRPATAAST